MRKDESIARMVGARVRRARRAAQEAMARARGENGEHISIAGRTNVVVRANIGQDNHAAIAHGQQDVPIVQGPSEGEPSREPRSGT